MAHAQGLQVGIGYWLGALGLSSSVHGAQQRPLGLLHKQPSEHAGWLPRAKNLIEGGRSTRHCYDSVTWCQPCYTLLVEANTKAHAGSRGGDTDQTSLWRSSNVLKHVGQKETLLRCSVGKTSCHIRIPPRSPPRKMTFKSLPHSPAISSEARSTVLMVYWNFSKSKFTKRLVKTKPPLPCSSLLYISSTLLPNRQQSVAPMQLNSSCPHLSTFTYSNLWIPFHQIV